MPPDRLGLSKNKRGGGHISITGGIENDQVRFCVSDTGIGMTQQQLTDLIRMVDGKDRKDTKDISERKGVKENIKTGIGHFGLSNVAERLRLNYGESSGLVFSSTYGEGTKVEITIPVIRETKGEQTGSEYNS